MRPLAGTPHHPRTHPSRLARLSLEENARAQPHTVVPAQRISAGRLSLSRRRALPCRSHRVPPAPSRAHRPLLSLSASTRTGHRPSLVLPNPNSSPSALSVGFAQAQRWQLHELDPWRRRRGLDRNRRLRDSDLIVGCGRQWPHGSSLARHCGCGCPGSIASSASWVSRMRCNAPCARLACCAGAPSWRRRRTWPRAWRRRRGRPKRLGGVTASDFVDLILSLISSKIDLW